MTPLNKQPIGLLDFFGIKNGGRYPQFLTEGLQGQLDLLPLYECAGAIEQGSSTGAIVGGVTVYGPAGLSTDPGNSWHFQATSIRFNASAAGSYAGVRLGVYYSPSATFVALTETIYAAQGVAPVVKGAYARDIWIGPGWSLAFEVIELNAAVSFETAWMGTLYRW